MFSRSLQKVAFLLIAELQLARQKQLINRIENSPLTLEQFLQKFNLKKKEDLFDLIDQTDPTNNNKYSLWILEQFFKNQINQQNPQEDSLILKELLEKFIVYSRKAKWHNANLPTDLQLLTKAELFQAIQSFEGAKEQNILELVQETKGASILGKSGPYLFIKIETPEASQILCQNSAWCVRHPQTAQDYLKDGPLYYILKDGQQYALVHYATNQFMDPADEELSKAEINQFLPALLKLTHPDLKIEGKTLWVNPQKELPPLRKLNIQEIKTIGPPIFNGNLDLSNTPITRLPEGLVVQGSLYLNRTPITELPEGLVVRGSLDLTYTPITKLPDRLVVREYLNLSRTKITSLPEGLKVQGNLNLFSTPITELPEGLVVGGDLNLAYTPITSLPEGLVVGEDLNLRKTPITELPEGLKVRGNLDLTNTPITELPEGLVVRGSLYLTNTSIISLPEGLVVGGNLDLFNTPITELPEGLIVGGSLYLTNTSITSLPEGLEVGGIISKYP